MPSNTGMTFVVVMHLSPHHTSTMAEMIQKWTAMKVVQAEDGQEVAADHVYVIPPAKHLTAVDGHLKLTNLDQVMGRRVAVDLFFRSITARHLKA